MTDHDHYGFAVGDVVIITHRVPALRPFSLAAVWRRLSWCARNRRWSKLMKLGVGGSLYGGIVDRIQIHGTRYELSVTKSQLNREMGMLGSSFRAEEVFRPLELRLEVEGEVVWVG